MAQEITGAPFTDDLDLFRIVSTSTPNNALVVTATGQLEVTTDIQCAKLKNDGEEFIKYGHVINASLNLEKDRVVVRFACTECNEILGEKVLFKLPKSKKKEKCLTRMVKGDK